MRAAVAGYHHSGKRQSPKTSGQRRVRRRLSHRREINSQSGNRVSSSKHEGKPADKAHDRLLKALEIPGRAELLAQRKPEIYVSYAWDAAAKTASKNARQRKKLVEGMCKKLGKEGWKVVRDAVAMGPGEQISTFMKRLTQADRVIVVLSDKYLHSPYCMAELYGIYQRSLEQKEEFLQRVIPLALADARFRDWRDRVACARHWRTEFEDMEQNLKDLGKADFALYKSMKDWHNHVNDILADVNDVLSPYGFKEIVKDDFAKLRQMLSRWR